MKKLFAIQLAAGIFWAAQATAASPGYNWTGFYVGGYTGDMVRIGFNYKFGN